MKLSSIEVVYRGYRVQDMSSPPSGHSDEELAHLHLAGNPEAFQSLVERYARSLYGYARRLTGNDADAEDIAQETFVRLHKNLKKLQLDRPLKPWLFRVCTNLCRNLAKRKKSLLFTQLEDASDEQEGIAFIETIADAKPTPEARLVQSSQKQEVRSAVQRLPHKYQVVIALYYFEGLSYEEMAEALSLPVNTIRTHLKRAKEHLHSSLKHFL